METNKILEADVLDLLFDGRNKEYGAYELRKTYNSRLGRAIMGMMGVVVVVFCFGFVNKGKRGKTTMTVSDPVVITALPKAAPPPVPPPVRVLPSKPQVATIRVTPPRIVPDDQVKKEEIPLNDKIEDAKIGTVNTDGVKDAGVDVAPPLNTGNGDVVSAPRKEGDDNGFVPVEKESEFPGGAAAWLRFLNKNLRYPDDALINEIQGVVQVRFIVDKDGNVSDVEAISGPADGGLREEAARVIRRSGKWTPALQNGRYVRSYKIQPITFHIDTNN